MEFDYLNVQASLSAMLLALVYIIYKLGERNYKEFERRKMVYLKPTLVETITQQIISNRRCLDKPNDYYTQFKGNRAVGFFHYSMPCIYVLDPAVLKLVLVKDYDHFPNRYQFTPERDDTLFSRVILSITGNRWRQMRSVVTPAFTPSKMKSVMFDVIVAKSESFASHIADKCNVSGEAKRTFSVDLKMISQLFSLDTMAEAAFGITENSWGDGGSELKSVVEEASAFKGYVGYKFFLAKVLPHVFKLFGINKESPRVCEFFCSLTKKSVDLNEMYEIRRLNAAYYLSEAQKKEKHVLKGEKEREITDVDIAAHAFNFIGGNYDSTGQSHGHLAYLLAMNPEVQERARQEIEEILEQDGGRITYEGIQRMKYLEQVISEGLRYFPPATINDRTCVRDYVVPATESSPAITFKKGDIVVVSMLGLHRDPELFPEPERFDPDRWSDENKHKIDPYAFMPFGAGPRTCIANRYVYMETKVLFATLLTRFNLVKTRKTPSNINVTVNSMYMINTAGFWIGIQPRVKSDE